MTELVSYEPKRGCGFREVGKLYLVGEGIAWVCPSLPLIFKPCECCTYEPPQYRDFQWIAKAYMKHIRAPTGVECHPHCPVCYPGVTYQERYGLMWVGKKYYNPVEFLTESEGMGVSKAIKQIPKGLVLGETWVMLAHPQAYIDNSDDRYIQDRNDWIRDDGPLKAEPKPPTYPGVFFAFIPDKVEMPIYQSEATKERVQELMAKGITPVVVPDDGTAHRRKTRASRGRVNK